MKPYKSKGPNLYEKIRFFMLSFRSRVHFLRERRQRLIELANSFRTCVPWDNNTFSVPLYWCKGAKGTVNRINTCPICSTPMLDDSEYVDIGIGSVPVTHAMECINPYCYGYRESNSGLSVVCLIETWWGGPFPYKEVDSKGIKRLSKKMNPKHRYPEFVSRYADPIDPDLPQE